MTCPARPHLRFSLRAMLVWLTVGCILLGWQVEQRRRLMIAAERVQNTTGCRVISFREYDYGAPYELTELVTRFWDPQVLPSIVVADRVGDEQTVAAISRRTTIEELIFRGDDACDDWMRHVES